MPRISRVVIPDLPHHVTQRGNNKQDTFASDEDRLVYLDLLRVHARRFGARIWAWCLMSNHVHLLAVPSREDTLSCTLARTHARYAQYWNARRRGCGHLWQARFFSCPVESATAWVVARYVETNPVRAGMVPEAEHWRWSSARAHLTGRDEFHLLDFSAWAGEYVTARWQEVLRTSVDDEAWQRRLEESTVNGRPLGTEAFVEELEARLSRRLRPKLPGRSAKAGDDQTAQGRRSTASEIGI